MSIASNALPPELVRRFKAALDRLNPGGGKIGLAVSGGPDSMAMLLLAHEAIPGAFEVATVNHGLRPEAADECALVAAACAERGVPCEVLAVEVGRGNVQAEAREARYAALVRWAFARNLSAVATAHHADDQAETLLMRLNRGSGLSGLAGIRPIRPYFEASIVRPLLDWRRSELERICSAAGIEVVVDPSNRDDTFERVRVRKFLASSDWLDPASLAKSAEFLAEALDYVNGQMETAWNAQVAKRDEGFDYHPDELRFVNIQIVHYYIEQICGETSRSDVARMVDRLWSGQPASLRGMLARPVVDPARSLGVGGRIWVFRPEPPRRSG